MTGIRLVRGLEWARTCSWPAQIPHPRPRRGSAKAAGLAYERALAGVMPEAKPGQWFEFWDAQGHGWCQVDLMLEGASTVLVMEAKYSWIPEAQVKLTGLYCPVVARALGKPALGITVAKRLVPELRGSGAKVAASLGEAVALAREGIPVVWHWLGSGPLLGARTSSPNLTKAPGKVPMLGRSGGMPLG